MKSDEILARLLTLHPKLIDLTLDRTQALLDRLGNPERRLPPVVHVAGTNGKGSVIAFLRAMLEADGRRVHVYTSPHLVRFAERIVLAGRQIAEPALVDLLEHCEAVNDGIPITFFEITTAAAFDAFAKTPADATLVEVGLGGRFDSTNVITHPALSVITPISMDHMQYLGDTLGEIAFEKAGILKPGVPAVIAPQETEAEAVIARRATETGAELVLGGSDWSCVEQGEGLLYRDREGALSLPLPSLPGAHQRRNAAQAVACARRLPDGLRPSDAAIRDGVRRAAWPGRLQSLTGHPYLRRLPAGSALWLDGAHNRGAAAAVADSVAVLGGAPLDMVVGMLETKDSAAFFEALRPIAARLRTVPIPDTQAAVPADILAESARRAGLAAEPAESVPAALDSLAQAAGGPLRVLILGSLYLAGAVLSEAAPDL